MNFRRLLSVSGIILALGAGLFLVHAHPALAQVNNADFQAVGQTAQLGTADPRVIAARIINIFLGLMGIIMLVIVLYAGFIWMTAGGDTEKVEKAQKTLRNAIIGLVIIMGSWGFVTFVLNKLLQATGTGTGGIISSDDGSGGGGELGAAGGSLGFQVRSIMPSGSVPIRNVEVRFLFSREVMASSVTSSITVVRASDNQPVEGTFTISDTLVNFVPSAACPAPNGDRKCFAQDTEYIAKVARSLRSRSGLTIACGRTTPPCEVRFKTGNRVDVNPPTASITTPLDGQGIPVGDTVRITVRSADDGGISLTDIFVDGVRIGRDASTATTTPTAYDATVLWDTRTVATGTHIIQAHVWDVDSNSVTTTPVTVAVRPRSFFNGVQDNGVPEVGCGGPGQLACVGGSCTSGSGCLSGLCSGGLCRAIPAGPEVGCGRPGQPTCIGGSCTSGLSCLSGLCDGGICRARGETGVDCGGIGGGACTGAVCTRGVDCASGMCLAGRCVEQPIIGSFNPVDGRPGTYVTISGANFGTTTGRVLFAGRPASPPAACAAGTASWSPTQIIVAVPDGATTSSIQVTNAVNGLSDSTNDDRGPRLDDFRVNGVAHPGLCTIRPGSGTVGDSARIAVAGVNLGSTTGLLYFNDRSVSVSAWRPTGIDLVSPLVPPGGYSVRARVNGMESNPVAFNFSDRVITSPPTIDLLRPATGTVGSYVTVVGRNFGSGGRVFFRQPTTGALGEADVRFPAECSSNFWSDTSVMVKVPASLRGGLGEVQPVRAGTYELYIQRDGITQSNHVPFTVFDGAPGPGICGILPVAGPIGTGVTIVGERFGSTVGGVTFAGATASGTRQSAFLSSASWGDAAIRTRVPAGSGPGMVRVVANGQTSNDAYFSVASCLTSPGICGPSLACCPDGSCAVGGVCPAISAATSTFAWRTSTGRLYQSPRVVEECTNEDPPSPSPRGPNICINAQAVVRFTTHIEAATINTSNVLVRRCTGVTADPCATGTPETVSGTLAFHAGTTQDYLTFTPTGQLWAPSSTYQIILTTGIRATSGDGGHAMIEDAENYGAGHSYAYRFVTRLGGDLCAARTVSVVPSHWTMQEIGQSKDDYTLSPRAEDICVQLNPDTMGWNWSVSDAGRASVRPNNTTDSSSSTVTGLGATDRDPVLINAELIRPAPPSPVAGSGELIVRLTPPRVISYAPNCDQACVNAAVWARFNVAMDRTTITHLVGGRRLPNLQIQRCTNESCRDFDLTLDLSDSLVDLITPPGTSATDTMLKVEATRPATDPVTRLPIRVSLLEPGKYYKATLFGGESGLKSSYGHLPLTGMNESDPLGFSWKFRVKTGSDAHCTAARVEVDPSEKYEAAFGFRQLFLASPISAPDSCSRDGQMLVSERDTAWTTSDNQVADFAQIGGARSSIALADSLPQSCTNQCLNAGSNGVFGRTAICGNSTVETADTNYCHRRTDATRECAVGDSDCVTRFGNPCLILPAGSQDSEECDNGSSNGTAGTCSTSCLWNPMRRVTDTPAGTCGNGTVQAGEQCDPGRVCVGGPTPGRDCTLVPTSCGTGGTCTVVGRRGCSTQCQALGATAGNSTCGNADLSDGETCDYSTGVASGCTNQCLHRGSSSAERRLCGNGRIEAGESCEMQVAGDPSSQYCTVIGGVRTCLAGTHFSDYCDVNTCLNLGTNRCQHLSDHDCCGNGRREAGEECDGGPGCTNRCLMAGSSPSYPTPSLCGDRTVGIGEQCDAAPLSTAPGAEIPDRSDITNRQLFEIVGLREPTPAEIRDNAGRMSSTIGATYQGRNGTAIYGVQCNFQREADCRTSGTGLTTGGCCAVRPRATPYPRDGATDVCRNVLVSAQFNQLMNEGSIRGNFLVSAPAISGTCATGTRSLDDAVPTAFDWHAPFRSLVAWVRSWFAPADAGTAPTWCTGVVHGTVVFETNNETHTTTAEYLLDQALQANTQYRITLLGDPNIHDATTSSTRRGLRSLNGVYADGNISWSFTTGDRVCTIDELRLIDTNVTHPTIFYKSNEAHQYLGRAVSYNHDEVVPLSPIPGLYSWAWRDWASSRPNILTVASAPTTPQVSMATTTARNQRGTSIIATGVTITADRVSASSTAGQSRDASLLSTVLLCDNPWTPPGTLPGQPPRFEDTDYHFAMNYCLDAGKAGDSDDLPELLVNRLADNPSDTARGVERQYIFSFSSPTFRSDAIGLRVMSNPLHLSPKDWYTAQGFAGSPQATTVDGYEAIRDGSTLYIASTNVDFLNGGLKTNIYVLSRNPDAQSETINIFEQLVDNFAFNTNLLHDADNTCRTQTGDVFRVGTSTQIINCTADSECVRYDSHGYCASSKDKLQRDLKRIADLQYMAGELETAKKRNGHYPDLATGTFLQTFVTSRWPSWQSVFAQSIGKAMPEDPLNVHLTCGQCLASRAACMDDSDCGNNDRCVPKNGFDPGTCWNAASSTYQCPILEPSNPHSISRTYQYRSIDRGNRYELGTEMEYRPIEEYVPSVQPETRRCVSTGSSDGRICRQDSDCVVYAADRVTIVSKGTCTPQGGRLQFSNVCTNQTLGLGGICGDGVVGGSEVCEPGQTHRIDCPIGGIAGAGTRLQVCRNDCSGYVDQPTAACQPKIVCGNGRVEAGETCDDGAQNGTYGHCNRTCSGFAAVCGDGQLSAGETCDLRDQNGIYCDTRASGLGGACTLNATCGADCRSVAPHCGDGVVQTQEIGDGGPVEECDGNAPEVSTSAVCSAGRTGAACNPSNNGADCAYGPISGRDLCARNAADHACADIKVGRCAGGVHDGAIATSPDCTCPTGQTSCASSVCGVANRCIMYDTQRTRTCLMPGSTPVDNQCHWTPWSACRPAHMCGDGVLDAGEACDDGNRNDNDSCTNRCTVNVCGDGVMNVGAEECDYGADNGHGCSSAEYGSTCAACTNQCRMTASSGGYCGNGRKDGAEQCDGTDFGGRSGSTLTCSALGYDYAEYVRCAHRAYVSSIPIEGNPHGVLACTSEGDLTCTAENLSSLCSADRDCSFHPASTTPEPVPAEFADRVCTGVRTDAITCSRTCGFSGCQVCGATGGNGRISAVVRDAVYSNVAVPGATVSLAQNGRRIATQTTDSSGRFTFSGLNDNVSCGGYRIYVEFTGNNPGTPDNEATNGGYWMYESDLFSVPNFEREGIHSSSNPPQIFLLPKVATNETLVVHTWYGNLHDLGDRYLLSHLILPQDRAYRYDRTGRTWNQNAACTALMVPGWAGGQPCYRDIREQDTGLETQGNPDLTSYPNARLFCSSGASGVCYQVANAPQATRYRWRNGGTEVGNFSYFLVDQRSVTGAGMSPSYRYYQQTSSTVWIVTHDRVYKVLPPITSQARCQGKFWLVFQQDSATGAITVMNDPAAALRCGTEVIPGETGVNALPGPSWPSDESTSWMAFGRWGGEASSNVNWDTPGSGPGAR